MVEHINPSVLDLVLPTDTLLNKSAKEVSREEVSSPFVQGVIDRMLALAAGKGHDKEDSRQMVGLAAVQLGVGLRVITIDVTADGSNKEQTLRAFINPEISEHSDDTVLGREGCWSCGNICGAVERSTDVTLRALNREGMSVELKLSGFIARIAQHEIDHLNGVRFPDRIPLDLPERLHWVEPANFERYRSEWSHWEMLCPRERWEDMKAGVKA